METTAHIEGSFRYDLTRTWDRSKPRMMIVGLNPSTADETKDDPTIRRCIGFAKRENMGGLVMCNLFAFRTKSPTLLKRQLSIVGNQNDDVLRKHAATAGIIVAAWGMHGSYAHRDEEVTSLLAGAGHSVYCFGLTQKGYPRHPLYLKKTTALEIYQRAT